MPILMAALTLGGLLTATLPVSAATRVKNSAKPVLTVMDASQEDEMVRTETGSRLVPLSEKRVNKKPTLMRLPVMSRASQTTETLLDSVVTSVNGSSTSKTVYGYNDFGRRTLTANLEFNTANATWDTLSSTVYQFNEAGYEVLYERYDWDNINGRPRPVDKTTSIYGTDGNNNLTMVRTDYYWMRDSARWMESGKQEVVFIGQQAQVYQQLIEYDYSIQTGWIPYHKFEQFEKTEGYSLVVINYTWVDSVQKWEGSYKSGYLYDEVTERTILESSFTWSKDLGLWFERTDNTFLDNGKIESVSKYRFNTATQAWDPIDRSVFDYEGDEWFDQLTISQRWDAVNAVWVNVYKTGGEEDSAMGETSRFVRYDWEVATSEWKGVTYWSKEWDTNGNLQAESRYLYSPDKEWALVYDLWAEYDNPTNAEWLVTTWMESEYNFKGDRTSYTQMYRPTSQDPWVSNYTFKQTFQFNEKGLRLQIHTYDWDDTNKVWINAWKSDCTINEAGSYAFTVLYKWQVTDWVETSRNTYFYSQKLVGMKAVQVRLEVYPNPVSDRLVIKGATEGDVVMVRDLNGRTMRTLKAADGETSVNMADVPAGMYLVQVGKQVVKIVK